MHAQAATWTAVQGVLAGLERSSRKELTVLVMGKAGSGVSSTANALLGNPEFDVRPAHMSKVSSNLSWKLREEAMFQTLQGGEQPCFRLFWS
jgi:predicted GTPase